VSKQWKGVAAFAGLLSVIWLVFIQYGSPWTGLMWVLTLALAAAVLASRHDELSSPSIGQVISALESERAPATVAAIQAATRAPKAVL
jgi:hypothetical protein